MLGEKHFISDNASGVHPDVLAALARVNAGHVPAYGEDAITARAAETLRSHFGPRCEVLFALTGTGANVFALQSLIQSWQAIICADSSHLHLALFESDLWLRNALHANAMAARLAQAVADVDGLEIVMPVESNAVFARLPHEAIAPLQRQSAFVVWRSADAVVRWMTSWDTTEDDIDRFPELVHQTLHY
jgi:threonine aldolase